MTKQFSFLFPVLHIVINCKITLIAFVQWCFANHVAIDNPKAHLQCKYFIFMTIHYTNSACL